MEAQPYAELSNLKLLALCCWREARGEGADGKRGVCHVIRNRIAKGGWWGHDWQSVILHPWQFSSFNATDPNNLKWPDEDDASWIQSMSIASGVYLNMDDDNTQGAQFYHDISVGWPNWGNPASYVETLNVGRLKFYRSVT